ncbi:mediator of RNA polymerase II transcription subunit 5 [Entomortierella parvispora]|uniref:Mediator of RNA polymerase II transcription subunit 5 n=1 Tax=Entomortierella parvispora TaxID=205924 RepID=A0A9P3HAS6_9FUNG|nr:mediator of RNA polymerase II transcription subunit 5 [Entomortierella parvispora]
MDSWTSIDASITAVPGAEALCPPDIMYLTFSMARIRPAIPDALIVQRLKDTQQIKTLEMDTVLLQFWLAGLTGLAEASTLDQRVIWKSVVLVKIPSIAVQLSSATDEVCTVVESSLRQLSFYRGILNECDENIAEDHSGEKMDILQSIVIGCVNKGVVRQDQLDILNGLSLPRETLSEWQYLDNPTVEDIEELCGRILSDSENQEALVDRIIKVCDDAGSKSDVSTLSKACQMLDDNPLVLDTIHLLRSPSALLRPLESFVNNMQQYEDDDIETCNAKLEGLGIVLILILNIVRRYELAGCLDLVLAEKQGFCCQWLHRTSATIPPTAISSMSPAMQSLMGRWITALFDSMGISDDLIQTSKPQMLLEIAPSIFEQSLAACQAGVLDTTTMISGLDYFLQPCLLFVLIGVVQFLCEEITFSSISTLSQPGSGNGAPGSNPPTVSPAGHVVSPLASRGGPGGKTSAISHGSGKNAASLGMLQSSLKSLLAGEAFPLRLLRLLKNEISAALSHPAVEVDDQLTMIQNRLLEATNGFYSWSTSEPYDVSKLAMQTASSFESIITGGRTSIVTTREKGWPVFGKTSFHIDIDLFRATLCYLGPSQFLTAILKQVLKAGLTANGRRAAELGAAIMTTPLLSSGNEYVSPQSLLWTLVYQILWIPVPGRLETFAQGRMLAVFVGMTLDYFQSDTFVQLRQSQGPQGFSIKGNDGAAGTKELNGTSSDQRNISQAQLERDAAVEPFRTMLEQRLEFLETIAHDRPGFKGFVQGMGQHKEQRLARI